MRGGINGQLQYQINVFSKSSPPSNFNATLGIHFQRRTSFQIVMEIMECTIAEIDKETKINYHMVILATVRLRFFFFLI